MNKLQLFRLLRRNTNLSYRRSAAFEQNQWAKVLIYLGAGFFALYLIIYGTAIGAAAEGEPGTIISFMILILPIDFLLRFIFGTTPAMMVKPHILMPISRYTAIVVLPRLVACQRLQPSSRLAMIIPYSIIVIAGGGGWGGHAARDAHIVAAHHAQQPGIPLLPYTRQP